MAQSRKFGVRADGTTVSAYRLKSESGFQAVILDQGAILQSLQLPNGRNITLGFDNWESYEADVNYIGRIIGPNANRISNACFKIGEDKFELTANDGIHNLHSGPDGFDVQSWTAKQTDAGLTLRLFAPNNQNGFPGMTEVKLDVSLIQNRLRLEVEAICDQPTPMNITWHPYWNLDNSTKIDGHNLSVSSELRTQFETGNAYRVKHTRHDFRKSLPIGSTRLDCNYTRVRRTTLSSKSVFMTVTSSLPDMQIYTGDALLSSRSGIAIEPQFQPNDINIAQNCLLNPGEVYSHWIEYRFDLT